MSRSFLDLVVVSKGFSAAFRGYPRYVLGKEYCYDNDFIKAVCPMA